MKMESNYDTIFLKSIQEKCQWPLTCVFTSHEIVCALFIKKTGRKKWGNYSIAIIIIIITIIII